MSGVRRSTTAHALEEPRVVRGGRPPPQMLGTLADLASAPRGALPKLAVVIDVRGKALFNDMRETLAALENSGVDLSVLFLEASDEVPGVPLSSSAARTRCRPAGGSGRRRGGAGAAA
ncbi:RNase adapter RapZ [Kocuria rhizophila]|nr:RNase adapter RapZ [Kocuria rhizophila]